jgi:hypothetical protein
MFTSLGFLALFGFVVLIVLIVFGIRCASVDIFGSIRILLDYRYKRELVASFHAFSLFSTVYL